MNCNHKSIMTKKKAFTLIELLIVIAIIGILFIVLVSKVDFATDKAKATGVQTDFRSFQLALETVSKEKAGFNSFGWNTGDANANGVRDSVDEGDANEDGIYQDGETWTGHKKYLETWTNTYSLIRPGTTFESDGYDKDAIFALETAINKNLDPKLHITIDAKTGLITMANGAQDPWNTQYHGAYISAEDGMDRGAIVMYSNGANQKFGSEHNIANGVPTVIVPGNNKDGADDYSLIVCYTYTNGYGEVGNLTTGFSNNQTFMTGNGGNVNNVITPGGNGNNDDIEQPGETVLDGLFDDEGRQLASWDQLVNTYGLDITLDYGDAYYSNGYTKISTSLYSVLNNNNLLSGTTLIIGNDVERLGQRAFAGCDTITKIVLGEKVSTITGYTLDTLKNITEFDVHENNISFKAIDGNLYTKNGDTLIRYAPGKQDSEFTIASNVEIIGKYAFFNAVNLTKLNIDVGMKETQYNSFSGCVNLKDVYFSGTAEEWCNINFAQGVSPCDEKANPLVYHANLYFNNVLVEDLVIPSTITTIKKSAFAGCGSIKNIYLPKELTKICDGAFGDILGTSCPNLKNVLYAGTLSDWMKMTINSSPMKSGADLYCNNELITNVIVPSDITYIKEQTFHGCTSIVSVSMPNKVTSIKSRAFYNCSNLKHVTFSENLTTIGYAAFYYCVSLEDFDFPNSLQVIEQNAFNECNSLVNVTIPASLTTIYQASIEGDNLRTVTILAENPPSAKQNLMFGYADSNFTIFVPANAIDTYKQASNWSYYKNRIYAIE